MARVLFHLRPADWGALPTPEGSFPQLIPGVPLNSQQAQEGFQMERVIWKAQKSETKKSLAIPSHES